MIVLFQEIMQNPYQAIIDLLHTNQVKYTELNHEHIITSEQAAKVRGLKLSQGAKSLVIKADQEFVLAVVPGDKKLDTKKLRNILKVKNLRFATPEEVKQAVGCEIGACYPFGIIVNLKTYVDPSFENEKIISFSAGSHTKSIKMKWLDYLRVTQPEIVDISKRDII